MVMHQVLLGPTLWGGGDVACRPRMLTRWNLVGLFGVQGLGFGTEDKLAELTFQRVKRQTGQDPRAGWVTVAAETRGLYT